MLDDGEHFIGEVGDGLLADSFWDAVMSFCNPSDDSTNGVAIASDGDSIADRILKVSALKEATESRRDSTLAGFIKSIASLKIFDPKVLYRVAVGVFCNLENV